MQKKFIALAVAGLVSGGAFAQSNVTVYGVLDVGYLNSEVDQRLTNGSKQNASLSNTGWGQGALSVSRLGFKGTEALGNGLNANFILEMAVGNTGATSSVDPQTNPGTSLSTRLGQVGLSGAWGAVDLGRQNAVVDANIWSNTAGMKNNVVGSLYHGQSGVAMTDVRLSSVITYTSPNFSGFTFAGQYGSSSTDTDTAAGIAATDSKFTTFGATAVYSNGPLTAGLGYSANSANNGIATVTSNDANNRKAWVLNGSYDFKIAKVFGLYTDGSNKLNRTNGIAAAAPTATASTAGLSNNPGDSLTDVNGYELGVQVPLNNFTFFATYMNGERDYKTQGTALRYSVDVDGFQLGALYALSKRTTAYAAYGEVNNDFSNRTVSTQRNNDIQQYTVGLRHSF